jgi:hypothetical protein
MPQNTDKNKRLVSLFILGAVFFNYPLLSLFNHTSYILGFPVLYVYIFSLWLLMIVLMVVITTRRNHPDRQRPSNEQAP